MYKKTNLNSEMWFKKLIWLKIFQPNNVYSYINEIGTDLFVDFKTFNHNFFLKKFLFIDFFSTEWSLLNKPYSNMLISFMSLKSIKGDVIHLIFKNTTLVNYGLFYPALVWSYREQMEFYKIFIPLLKDYRNLLLDYGLFLNNSNKILKLYENYSYNYTANNIKFLTQSYPDL